MAELVLLALDPSLGDRARKALQKIGLKVENWNDPEKRRLEEPAEAVFGLGDADTAEQVTIDWPDGTRTVREGVGANQILTIVHGGFGDLDADGDVDLDDWALLAPCITGPTSGGIIYADDCRAADVDADGDVDLADGVVVIRRFVRD